MKISERNRMIADFYGWEAQSNQLMEECAELIQAVNKYRRAMGQGQHLAEYKSADVVYNLREEIADVEVMLEQIKYLLRIGDEVLQEIKDFKIDRTYHRITDKVVE